MEFRHKTVETEAIILPKKKEFQVSIIGRYILTNSKHDTWSKLDFENMARLHDFNCK